MTLFDYRQYSNITHWREPVKVGNTVVTCSSLPHDKEAVYRDPVPGFGIYLERRWGEYLGVYLTNGAYVKRVARARAYPALIVDVLDFRAPSVGVLSDLVEICLTKMRQGKRIDIGCMAGRGRTGMLLACLIARKEHLTGKEAIKAVRSRYLTTAIESKEQEQAVIRYAAGLGRR